MFSSLHIRFSVAAEISDRIEEKLFMVEKIIKFVIDLLSWRDGNLSTFILLEMDSKPNKFLSCHENSIMKKDKI